MKKTKLRSEVEKVRNLTDENWEYLEAKGFVGEAVDEVGEAGDNPVRYLVAELDLLHAAASSRVGFAKPKGRSTQEEKVPPQLSDYELERSESFAVYLAKQAVPSGAVRHSVDGPVTIYSGVKGFRVKYLDDELLSPQQARELLASPVAAHWHPLFFKERKLSVVGHTYRVTEDERDERGTYSLVQVPLSDGKTTSIQDRRPIQAGPWQIPGELGAAKRNRNPKRELKAPTAYWKILAFPGDDGYTHRVMVEGTSVLGKLYEEVTRLLRKYPWEEQDATWFVLTGQPPPVAPLTWQFRGIGGGPDSWSYGYITLKIEPWVSARLVERVYSGLQHQLLGKDNKRIGEKNRELFRFVLSRMDTDGSLPKARELVKEWDTKHPQWRYGHDDTQQVRRFRRDYNLVRRSLAAPTYELVEE